MILIKAPLAYMTTLGRSLNRTNWNQCWHRTVKQKSFMAIHTVLQLSNLLSLTIWGVEICLESKFGQFPYFQIGTNVPCIVLRFFWLHSDFSFQPLTNVTFPPRLSTTRVKLAKKS